MALVTKKQFADSCGLTTGNLSNYIGRNKVICDLKHPDLIDDEAEPNKSFKLMREGKGKVKSKENTTENKESANHPAEQLPDQKKRKKVRNIPPEYDPEGFSQQNTLYAIELEQKELGLQKTKEDIEVLQLKKQKMQGVVIPTDQVKILFVQHSKSITVSFQNAVEDILTQMAKKTSMSVETMAQLRGEFRKIINTAVNDSVENSKKQIKNIVKEYSETRGVGERN